MTVFYIALCFENIFRHVRTTLETEIKEKNESAMGQTSLILGLMIVMSVNSAIWILRSVFSKLTHMIHYIIASALIILFLPVAQLE